MTKHKLAWWGGAAVVVLLGLAGLKVFVHQPAKTPGEVLKKSIREMEFSPAWDVRGNDEGEGCHMLVRRMKDGTDEVWFQHTIQGRDFRNGSIEERQDWIRLDTERDIGELGIACSAPDPFFRSAYAPPPYCEDCGGGGGCISYGCPGTTPPVGLCTLGGTSCTITYFCCDWPCSGWPPC